MLKKILQSLAVLTIVFSTLAPISAQAANPVDISAKVAPMVVGAPLGVTTTVKQGEQGYYSVRITNSAITSLGGVMVRANMPTGLSLVPGSARLTYLDGTGATKTIAIADAIATTGTQIYDIPGSHYVLVSYKVNTNQVGSFAVTNQVTANGGVNVATNTGVINVTAATPATTTPATSTTNVTTSGTGAPSTSLTLNSYVYNLSKGEVNYTTQTTANPGDEVIYRMTVTNTSTTAKAKGVMVRAHLPAELEYVPGYAKVWFLDTDNKEKVVAVPDAIATTGAQIYDIAARNYMHVTYKVRVKPTTGNGVYGASNQVTANGGVNLSDNTARVMVSGSNVVNPPTPVDPTEPGETRSMTLSAVAYNSTVGGNVPYTSTVVAKRGQTVKFKIALNNTGNTDLANVKIAQSLPSHLSFVPGTAKVVAGGKTLTTADSVMTSGVNLGTARVGAGSYLEFEAVVKQDTPENTASLSYKATATADQTATVSSLVTITVDGKTEVLPDTGTSGNILAIILLALFLSTASYIYLKESGKLAQVVGMIKK